MRPRAKLPSPPFLSPAAPLSSAPSEKHTTTLNRVASTCPCGGDCSIRTSISSQAPTPSSIPTPSSSPTPYYQFRLQPQQSWLSLVTVHSNSWLLSVAFYLGARLNRSKRTGAGSVGSPDRDRPQLPCSCPRLPPAPSTDISGSWGVLSTFSLSTLSGPGIHLGLDPVLTELSALVSSLLANDLPSALGVGLSRSASYGLGFSSHSTRHSASASPSRPPSAGYGHRLSAPRHLDLP